MVVLERSNVEPAAGNAPHALRSFPSFRRTPAVVSAAVMLSSAALPGAAAPDAQTNASPAHLLLTDRFGNPIRVVTNQVPRLLQPQSPARLERQIPSPPKGAPMPQELRQRIAEHKTDQQW